MAKIFNFPGTGPDSKPMHLQPTEDVFRMLDATDVTHHTEIFDYADDSYVMLVQKKNQEFTSERIVFMAERLKLDAFGLLPDYSDNEASPDDKDDMPA